MISSQLGSVQMLPALADGGFSSLPEHGIIKRRRYSTALEYSIPVFDMNFNSRANFLQEAARLASDGELGNSDAIHLLQMPHSEFEIKEVLRRFDNQLSREAKAKLIREAYAPLPEGIDNQRFEPLFEKYHISGKTYTTQDGTVVLNEIHYYNGEMLHFHGECTNVEQVCLELAGSGYKPLVLNYGNGRQTAMAQVWANNLTDTSLRPYTSMFLVIPVVSEDTPTNLNVLRADDNGFSSALSMLRSSHNPATGVYENTARLYLARLYDSTKIAIDVGRERMGTDKRPGNTHLKRLGNALDLSITDGFGRVLTQGRLIPTENPQAYLPAIAHAASTAGITLNPLPRGTEYVFPAVARIGRLPCMNWEWRTDSILKFQPLMGDEVFFGTSTEEGEMLSRWGFAPKVLGHVPNVRGVITGLPDSPTVDLSAKQTANTLHAISKVSTTEQCVSRLLLPVPSVESRAVRYWRRS
jgi:hypothetical protein